MLCQRCGRTICAACQTQAAVGVHCPECVKSARQNMAKRPSVGVRTARAWRSSSGGPLATYAIIIICVAIYVLQVLSRDVLTRYLLYYPPFTALEPWTMFTAVFAHRSPIHLLLNMFSLFIIGRILESALGRARYLALFLISGFGGSVAVLLISPGISVVGASGAIFGMLGALFVIQRQLGGNTTGLLVVIVLNLAIGFLPGVAWQAHLGGLVTGAAIAYGYSRTRNNANQRVQWAVTGAIAAALVAITVVRVMA
jgi:membrane associated rhomboid family serine protease